MTSTAKAFETMIGSSFCMNPYHTHNESPEIRTIIMTHERSSAFLLLITFISCGIIDTEVRTPATIPNTFSSIRFFYSLPQDKEFFTVLSMIAIAVI